ncbi:MAG TPA: glycosyltransferase [Terriglobales bacterium]|nr:glycosyltransferase [Terriglobales bacterium]
MPARNEETCLGRCLESLRRQDGVSFEIIVVDDESSDRTREIAESFAGVKVIEAEALPVGWSGKTNAMASGARVARGAWLLFTDADTVHFPGSLARAIAEAKQNCATLLSYSPAQEVHGFWQKAVMPAIFAELAASYRPSEVSNPASAVAAANGQYLMLTREAYDAVGGHTAIANSLLEDVALARAVKASGRKIFFRFGGDVVRTRMYRSFTELTEGWTKNLVLLFSSPLRLAVLRFLEFVLITGSMAELINAVLHGRTQVAVASAVVALILGGVFWKRIRRAHFCWDANALALLGLPLFSYLLLRSCLFHKKGHVTWKGRRYKEGVSQQQSPKPLGDRPDAGATSWSI